MRKFINIRNNGQATVNDGKIYTKILPHPLSIKEITKNGSYKCDYNGRYVLFKKTPYGDYYTSLTSKKIRPLCYCSKPLDTVFCLVSRNANTSIVLSCLLREGLNVVDYPNDKLLWKDNKIMRYCYENKLIIPVQEVDFTKFSNFVMVIDDPIDRFVRVANKVYNDNEVIKELNDYKNDNDLKRFIDELIFYIDSCENDDDFLWERHMGLQYRYVDTCTKYKNDITFITLKDLPDWWKKTYNSKWLRNNVSKVRKINKNSFTEEQWNKILTIMDKEIKFYKEKNYV